MAESVKELGVVIHLAEDAAILIAETSSNAPQAQYAKIAKPVKIVGETEAGEIHVKTSAVSRQEEVEAGAKVSAETLQGFVFTQHQLKPQMMVQLEALEEMVVQEVQEAQEQPDRAEILSR